MTSKISAFGSLAQRQARMRGQTDPGTRHAWLDGNVPALVTDRRQVAGRWQGLLLYLGTAGPVHEWVDGDRITKTMN